MKRFKMWFCLILFLFTMAACAGRPEMPAVRLQTDESAPVAGEQRAAGKLPLRVAVAAVLSPEATFDNYGPLLDYLSQRLDRPVELLQRPTYAEINELVRTGQADVAFVCGGAFVEGEREGYMTLLAAPQVDGAVTYQSVVIVPADSPARSLEDLRGRRFAFTDPLSNSGRLYVTYLLWQQGETPESFFRETIFTYSHDNSVQAVADGIVDGAAVDSLVYHSLLRLQPDLADRTRVIHQSPAFGIPPVAVHPDLDPDLRTQVKQALLDMSTDPAGEAVLDTLHVDGFVAGDRSLYDSIRQMAAVVRGWQEATQVNDRSEP